MKAKKYLVMVGLALVCAVGRGAAIEGRGKEEAGGKPVEVREQGETLDGLEGVLVTTGIGLPEEIKAVGVSEARFRAKMKAMLSEHGIKTYSVKKYEESNRMPLLVLEVSSVGCKEQDGRYEVFMRLGLRQRVMLLTEPMRSVSAMTWQASSRGMMNKEFLHDDLKGMWEQLAEEFIRDFPGAVPVVQYWYRYLRGHKAPKELGPPGIVCAKCSEASGYRAVKCEKCELIFIRGTVPHDYADRCPECGHSKTEVLRKEARKNSK
jgi:hypothetical protein